MTEKQDPDINCDTLAMKGDCPQEETPSPGRVDMSDVIALHLREMSEQAFHAGLDNSSCLIEAVALVVEMEGRNTERD